MLWQFKYWLSSCFLWHVTTKHYSRSTMTTCLKHQGSRHWRTQDKEETRLRVLNLESFSILTHFSPPLESALPNHSHIYRDPEIANLSCIPFAFCFVSIVDFLFFCYLWDSSLFICQESLEKKQGKK